MSARWNERRFEAGGTSGSSAADLSLPSACLSTCTFSSEAKRLALVLLFDVSNLIEHDLEGI
jgi:hypothetical protein